MGAGRPAKPMYSPVEAAYADLDAGGALSYAGAAELSSLSEEEVEREARANAFETFRYKRRVLIVRKSFLLWLAGYLAADRQRRVLEIEVPSMNRD